MNKSVFLLIAALSFTFNSFSQKDAKAKDILDKSSKAYEQAENLSVRFTINIKNAGAGESFNGQLSLKGAKLRLSVPDAETWFDGKTQWVYMTGTQEVNISEPDAKDVQSINPVTIFSIYKKDCRYKFIAEKTDNKNRPVYEIELLPEGKSDMSRIVVQIHKTDNIPVFFHVYYKNKVENLIYINQYNTKQNHPDNLFTFDKTNYPDAEIIDLR